jgi:hypothetical protein
MVGVSIGARTTFSGLNTLVIGQYPAVLYGFDSPTIPGRRPSSADKEEVHSMVPAGNWIKLEILGLLSMPFCVSPVAALLSRLQ